MPEPPRRASHVDKSGSVRTRPPPACQLRPLALSNTVTSARPPSLNRCRITPLPRPISGTSSRSKTINFRFTPTDATISPATMAQATARADPARFSTCLPFRVCANAPCISTTRPWPVLAATSILPSPARTSLTISLSAGRSTIKLTGSPNPRPRGNLSPDSV